MNLLPALCILECHYNETFIAMFILDRLKESSTWVAIALILGLFGFGANAAEWITVNQSILTSFFAGLLALVGAFIPEKKQPDTN